MYNILIVDDIEANLFSLRSILEKNFNDIEIFESLDALNGLKIAMNNDIDLIISDIQMPNIDGFEFARFLQKSAKTKNIPIIYVTAIFNDDEYKQKGYELGAIDYIIKPLDEKLLVTRLNNYLKIIQLQNKIKKDLKRKDAILDNQKSIVLISDGIDIIDINKVFFEQFDFNDLKDFKSKHSCLCKLFQSNDSNEYILEYVNGVQWNKYIIQNPSDTHKCCMIDKDGNPRIYEINSSGCIFEEDNEEVIVFNDITKIMQQAKMLEEQSRLAAMGDMISMIAHQWRQPLTTITTAFGKVKLLRDMDMLDDKTFNENYENINSIIMYMSKTIDDFRNFFKSDNDKHNVEINKIIEMPKKLLNASLKIHKVEFNIDYKLASDTMININRSKFDQVLLNIYKNILDEIIEKQIENPIINVKCEDDGLYIIISIYDNAGGVPKDILPKIFNPYFSTKSKNGTGVGLYMSKIIVENHFNGTIKAYNKNDGACFEIRVPK